MFELKNTVGRRVKDRHIVLSQLRNFMEAGSFIDPDVLVGSYKYSWAKIEKYFYVELQAGIRREKNGSPIHYAVELVDKDYVVLVSQPLTVPSYWIQRLAEKGVIPPDFKDAIVVCLVDDYTVDIPDERMLRRLAHQLLTPLMSVFDIPRARVHYIDELVDWALLGSLVRGGELPYDKMTPAVYWDHAQLVFALQRFMKLGNN